MSTFDIVMLIYLAVTGLASIIIVMGNWHRVVKWGSAGFQLLLAVASFYGGAAVYIVALEFNEDAYSNIMSANEEIHLEIQTIKRKLDEIIDGQAGTEKAKELEEMRFVIADCIEEHNKQSEDYLHGIERENDDFRCEMKTHAHDGGAVNEGCGESSKSGGGSSGSNKETPFNMCIERLRSQK